jgi:regulatory protein
MFLKNNLSKEKALEKIKHYCSYQERCHSEVKTKLYSYNLRKNEVEEIISQLIEDNYLNEERFAIRFAGGKFRIKHWGRKKIQYELRQKGVNNFIISIALREIDEESYLTTLQKLARAKWNSLKSENSISRQSKTNAYLLQKGYEQSLISEVISSLK